MIQLNQKIVDTQHNEKTVFFCMLTYYWYNCKFQIHLIIILTSSPCKKLPKSVPVLLQESSCIVEDNPGKVVEAEGCVDVRFGLQVVAIVAMALVQLVEEGLVRPLWELGLLVHQCHDVQRPSIKPQNSQIKEDDAICHLQSMIPNEENTFMNGCSESHSI